MSSSWMPSKAELIVAAAAGGIAVAIGQSTLADRSEDTPLVRAWKGFREAPMVAFGTHAGAALIALILVPKVVEQLPPSVAAPLVN